MAAHRHTDPVISQLADDVVLLDGPVIVIWEMLVEPQTRKNLLTDVAAWEELKPVEIEAPLDTLLDDLLTCRPVVLDGLVRGPLANGVSASATESARSLRPRRDEAENAAALGEYVTIPERLVVAWTRDRVERRPVSEGPPLEPGAVIGCRRKRTRVVPIIAPIPARFLSWLVPDGERVPSGCVLAALRPNGSEV